MPRLRHLHISVASCLRVPSIDNKNLGYPLAPECLQTLSKIRFASCTKGSFCSNAISEKIISVKQKKIILLASPSNAFSILSSCNNLETMKCCFYMQNIIMHRTDWLVPSPSTIKRLTFSWSILPWSDLSLVSMLPKLEVLKLKNHAFRGPEWSPSEQGFHRLKYLLIGKTDLKHWNACNVRFPNLQHLVLLYCELLEEIPSDIGTIPTLELIELWYSSKSAEDSAEEIKEQVEGLDVRIQSNWILHSLSGGFISFYAGGFASSLFAFVLATPLAMTIFGQLHRC